MSDDDDAIPCEGSYRNVPLHKGQSLARLRQVTADIDAAHALTGINELCKFLRSARERPRQGTSQREGQGRHFDGPRAAPPAS